MSMDSDSLCAPFFSRAWAHSNSLFKLINLDYSNGIAMQNVVLCNVINRLSIIINQYVCHKIQRYDYIYWINTWRQQWHHNIKRCRQLHASIFSLYYTPNQLSIGNKNGGSHTVDLFEKWHTKPFRCGAIGTDFAPFTIARTIFMQWENVKSIEKAPQYDSEIYKLIKSNIMKIVLLLIMDRFT